MTYSGGFSPDVRRWVGLAGWVAEQIEIHGLEWAKKWPRNPWQLANHLRGRIQDGVISSTDLEMIGRWTQKDLAKVVRILLRNWQALLEWVEEVMANPRSGR